MNVEKNTRVPAIKTHDEMIADWMNDPAFKAEYDSLEKEYQLLRKNLHNRTDTKNHG